VVVGGIVTAALVRAALWRWPSCRFYCIVLNLVTRADGLLAGCLVGLLACWGRLPQSGWGRLALQAAGVASAALLVYLGFHARAEYDCMYYGGYSLASAASALLIAAIVSNPRRLLSRALGAAPLAATGRLAYGLYLWHFPLFGLVTHFIYCDWPSFHPGARTAIALNFAVTFAAALLSYHCVERPFLRWKARLARA
jgi:peptidoglycan/LPS O-acetylase OafA/YrhL